MQRTPNQSPNSKIELNRRGKLLIRLPLAIGALATFGLGAKVAIGDGIGAARVGAHATATGADRLARSFWGNGLTQDPTPKFPKGTPMAEVQVDRTWEGAQEVVAQVDPSLATSWSPEEQKVEDFVQQQGEATDKQLQFGQTVRVPIVGNPSNPTQTK